MQVCNVCARDGMELYGSCFCCLQRLCKHVNARFKQLISGGSSQAGPRHTAWDSAAVPRVLLASSNAMLPVRCASLCCRFSCLC